METKMNGPATARALNTAKVLDIASRRERESVVEPPDDGEKKLSRWQRFLINLHIKVMADEPTKPYWNPTMIGTWCSVVSLIIVLVSALAAGAFYMGVMHERNATMERELQEVKRTAQQAKDLNLANPPATSEEQK